ncbi:hypothetical protein VHEMI07207 [[Torrubiella] hemipterigena]|uniref:Fatty acid desaturase domain-containing protein n=1 Tax=[Torrubiella] hemipterigena TaxID=1531966 RepID=A0A0A1TKY2_9HYPO|nr:hypothetical protein VHEMI07207 [[Torrubiella] hemipterigena]
MATTTTTTTQTTVKSRKTVATGKTKQVEFPDIQTIRDAIPKDCFVPSTARSLSYVARDLILASALVYLAVTFIPTIENPIARYSAWMVYGWAQGLVCTGIWILAHEAGHGSFSVHPRLNDFVGWALHSSLGVPYFSWKFSHHRHHRFTSHMEKDMVFVPATKQDRKAGIHTLFLDPEIVEDAPIVNLIQLIAHQLAGWQMYMMFNISSGKDSKQRTEKSWLRQSHFEPTSAVFRPSEALYIALADLGLFLVGCGLYYASTLVGWAMVGWLYFVPYMWWNHWLNAAPTFTTLTPTFTTTTPRTGPTSRVLSLPLTVTLASLTSTSSTASLDSTLFTTFSLAFPSTRLRKPPRPSCPSSATSTTASPLRSSDPSGTPSASASMLRATLTTMVPCAGPRNKWRSNCIVHRCHPRTSTINHTQNRAATAAA